MIVLMHSIHTLFTSKVYPYNNNENIFIRIMYTVALLYCTVLLYIVGLPYFLKLIPWPVQGTTKTKKPIKKDTHTKQYVELMLHDIEKRTCTYAYKVKNA